MCAVQAHEKIGAEVHVSNCNTNTNISPTHRQHHPSNKTDKTYALYKSTSATSTHYTTPSSQYKRQNSQQPNIPNYTFNNILQILNTKYYIY